MNSLALAIENWPLAVALRRSIWVYPLVNTGHLLGLALLIGAIIPMDLRLLGVWRKHVSIQALSRVLVPVAATGLILAILMGGLLFVARAADYVNSTVFLIKLLVLVAAVANLGMTHAHLDWRSALETDVVSGRIRLAATLSVGLWLAVLLLGRLVGYR
jgi:hypothetical protein